MQNAGAARKLVLVLALVACVVASGCGFHFRGDTKLPFTSVYVVTTEYASFAADLKRYLASGSKTQVVERREDAEVILEVLSESNNKRILSLSTAGRVREFELRYRVTFRLIDKNKREWLAASEISQLRDFTYDDQAVLAKEGEESGLLRDMKNNALYMVLRRLAKAKPPETS